MKFVLLASFDNYMAAHILLARLEEQGIRCYLENEHSTTLTPYLNTVAGIRLLVAETQLERAREIMAEPPQGEA